jgi:ferredoxin
MAVVIDQSACSNCGACVDMCPNDALRKGDETVQLVEENCIDCGICVPECPSEAIRSGV